MIHELIINGTSTRLFKIFVLDADVSKGVEKDYSVVEVAGRNGDLHFDMGRYRNIRITYKCFADADAKNRINEFNSFLLSQGGYARIEDSFNPDIYREGEFIGGLEPKFGVFHKSGIFDLEFDCKPQKWLKSGENAVLFTETGTIENKSRFASLPRVKISGTGLITIGHIPVTVLENTQNDMIIDSGLQDVYGEQTLLNYNDKVQMPNGFPKLESGTNGIVMASGMTAEIIPRWWTV